MQVVKEERVYDVVIIGGGPAGLLAATYLGRFRRHTLLIDHQKSRAELIPLSHNYPGAVRGITGKNLLKALHEQASQYIASITQATVVRLEKTAVHYIVHTQENHYLTKNIILATGVSDVEPSVPYLKDKIAQGILRHCMICDGYEVIDQAVGIIGHDQHAANEAEFLWNYTHRITILTLGQHPTIEVNDLKKLLKKNIQVITKPIHNIKFHNNNGALVEFEDQSSFKLDSLYSALGFVAHSDLAQEIGVKVDEEKCIKTNEDQCTNIPGIYAIGDVTVGLKQMSVGFAQAAIAATHIHNQLSKMDE